MRSITDRSSSASLRTGRIIRWPKLSQTRWFKAVTLSLDDNWDLVRLLAIGTIMVILSFIFASHFLPR